MLLLRNKILLLLAALAVLIILVVVSIIFIGRSSEEKAGVDEADITAVDENVEIIDIQAGEDASVQPAEQPPVKKAPIDPDELFSKQLSRIFVERFGTHSSQNDNQHIDDVLPIVTDKMAAWLEDQRTEPSKEYSGVTTRVIASSVRSITSDTAIVQIDVQQEIETAQTKEIIYQAGRVELVKLQGDWKINGLYWEDTD